MAEAAAPRVAVPRWLPAATLLLSLVGLAISTYLTIEHYGGNTALACPDTGTINCLKVTTSPQSVVLGLPVAVYGLAFFVVMTGLTLPRAWRATDPLVAHVRMLAAVAGMATVLWLVYVELFEVDAVCLWCTAVHVLTFLLFILVLAAGVARTPLET